MTREEYYAEIHRLKLTPSTVPGVYWTADRTCQSVPDPKGMSDFQMRRALWKIAVALGEADPNDPPQPSIIA
jgi:hypothetical protein